MPKISFGGGSSPSAPPLNTPLTMSLAPFPI